MGRRRCCCEGAGELRTHCRWPCCVWGGQFKISASAEDLDVGGDGWFIIENMQVKVFHLDGSDTDWSLNHAGFNNVASESSLDWYFGGGDHMRFFGLDVETEEFLCFNDSTEGRAVDVTLTFRNTSEVGNQGRIFLSSPFFSVFWGEGDGQQLEFLAAYSSDVWGNIGNAPSTHYADVDDLDTVSITYFFGHVQGLGTDTADDMRTAVCHLCGELKSVDKVHRTAPCTGVKELDIPDRYQNDGTICYTQLPCEVDDDITQRIGEYTVEDDCDDEDCPDCVCTDLPGDTWIWSTGDNVYWEDADDAIWTDSLGGSCFCGCQSADLNLGNPGYLDLPQAPAVGVNPTNLAFSVCAHTFGVVTPTKWAMPVFAHDTSGYKKTFPNAHIPFYIVWADSKKTWRARLVGTNLVGDYTSFSVDGPEHPGIIPCRYHSVHLRYDIGSGEWDLGVDLANGANYTYGDPVTEPPGFSLPGFLSYYWGAYDPAQPDGHGTYAPPGSLQTA